MLGDRVVYRAMNHPDDVGSSTDRVEVLDRAECRGSAIGHHDIRSSDMVDGPIVCPERLVAAPRGTTGTLSSAAIRTAVTTYSAVLGTTTPTGSIWYRLASVA